MDNKKTIVLLLVVIGILVIMAGIQTFQLSTISKAIATGKIGTVSASSGSAGTSALSSVQSQVGGCG